VLAVTVFLNPMVERLKPTILSKAQQILNTPVDITSVSVSLFPSTELELSGAALGGISGVTAERVYLQTSLQKILAGELSVSEVKVDRPSVSIEKLRDGTIKIGDLILGAKKEPTDREAHSRSSSAGIKGLDKSSGAESLKLSKLRITGGTVVFRDPGLAEPIKISDINLTASELSLNGDASFELNASTFGDQSGNLKLAGNFSPKSLLDGAPKVSFTLSQSAFSLRKIQDLLKASLEKDNSTLTANGELLVSARGEVLGEALKSTITFSLPTGEITFTPQNN
jgi:uncharacterized protein involved in outer membrane biogenesis